MINCSFFFTLINKKFKTKLPLSANTKFLSPYDIKCPRNISRYSLST